MNKVVGIVIAVVAIAVIIVAAMSFSNDPNTTITQVGPFLVESSQEISKIETDNGTDYTIVLTESIGVKP